MIPNNKSLGNSVKIVQDENRDEYTQRMVGTFSNLHKIYHLVATCDNGRINAVKLYVLVAFSNTEILSNKHAF